MRLVIVVDEGKQTVGTYQLGRGEQGHVFKCR
jgi:hypothetical protein